MNIKKLSALMLTIVILSSGAFICGSYAKTSLTDAQTAYEYININSWKEYNDAYLLEYISKAVENNHKLKISSLKTDEAVFQKNIVRAGEMPSLGTGVVPALYKLPLSTVSDSLIALPAYVNYEADIFGKNRDKTKSYDKLVEISKLNEKSDYISVVSAVAAAYYNIVKLDKLIDIQSEVITDSKRIYVLMKLSNDEGLVSAADTVNAHKLYVKSEADLSDMKKCRERLLNLLCVLIAESPENSDELNRISYDELVVKNDIPDSIPSDIIFSRPDYLTAEKMLEKSGIDVRVAKKEFLPSFNIFGLLSFSSSSLLSQMNWTNSVALLSGGAFLPLFTGGRKISNYKLKKNKYEQAVENYKNTALTSIQEVNDALCDLKFDYDKYNKTLNLYNDEKSDFSYTKLKFNEGVLSRLDLLQKREALLNSEKLLVSQKISYFIDKIELYKATAASI